MVACFWRTGHPLADGLEDVGTPQIWNQQTENGATFISGRRADISAGSCDPFNDTAVFQFTHSPSHGDSRRPELPHQLRFAGKLLSRPVLTARDVARELVQNLAIFRTVCPVDCNACPHLKLILQLYNSK